MNLTKPKRRSEKQVYTRKLPLLSDIADRAGESIMAKKENSEEMEKVDILSDLSALILSVNAELKFDDEDPGITTAAKKVKINKKLKTVTLDVQSPDEKD